MRKTAAEFILFVSLVAAAASPSAGVPLALNYQGRLLDEEGRPLVGNVNVAVAIHDAAEGGTALYSETVGTVAVENGVCSFSFGGAGTGLLAVVESPECWLELSINGEALHPRHRLMSVPFALRSFKSDVEDDPVFAASSAGGISAVDTGRWTTAWQWGDHREAGYATGSTAYAETDPIWTASSNLYHLKTEANELFLPRSGGVVTGSLHVVSGNFSVGSNQLVITAGGHIGLGTSSPTNRLEVNGAIKAKEIVVTLDDWPDYVFESGHRRLSLSELEIFIESHGHLPGIPSAAETAGGVSLGAMQSKLLEKIEELTLYVIELHKENERLGRILRERAPEVGREEGDHW